MTRDEFISATVLGVDHGLSRIGVALKPAGQNWALPIRVLEVRNEQEAISETRKLIGEYRPAAVVIGLPRHADDRQVKCVRRFARKTREGTTGVRWLFTDEQLTSARAEELIHETAALSRHKKARDTPLDDIAAKLILEQYLASLQ